MNTSSPRPPAPRRAPRRILRPLQARAAARGEEFEDYDEESEPNMKFSHALIVVLVLHILAVGGVFAFNMLKTSHALPDKQKASVSEKQKTRPPAAAPAATVAPAAQTTAVKAEAKPPVAGTAHTVAAGDTLTKIASQHKTTVEEIERANGLAAAATIRIGQVLNIKPAARKESTPVEKKPDVKAAAAPAAVPKAVPAKSSAPAAAPVAAAKAAASPAPKAQHPASGDSYTVAKGENPYSIAKKLKISYSELLKVNKIEDPTKLQIGQKLTIP